MRDLRQDARRNRERIIAAARELFAEHDLDVATSEIARRAGVGAATIYRRFPTRDALVAAVFTNRVNECVSSILDASRDPDAWRGFCAAIEALCTVDADGRGLTRSFLAAVPGGASEFDGQRRVAEAAFADLVKRAKDAGELRPDFGREDLALVLAANAGLVQGDVAARRAASKKLAGYLLAGFRAASAS
ncbi:TetR/AcrR family transcriptional regulator [Agromyces agglutinans]|uniref:TetR/AcrR family transcriptional regulator n=1 Tax=Agromyces agglutinans TaxID=2662258 RepID=UPI001561D393|nr:TetR/AcrR family transcriptional regulator [Agromyces agglutinans]